MNIYTPYFYIIQHIESKKLYAGSRWAKNCHPEELMQPKGYQTSSPLIHEIVKREGVHSFMIIRTDTYCDNIHPYEYESLFLQSINCAKSHDWYNSHNNKGMSFGLPEFYEKTKETLLNRYGVSHNSQMDDFVSKIKKTSFERYGEENWKNPEKNKETCFAKYGDWTVNISRLAYCIEKNVTNVSQISGNSKKVADTKKEKYGDSAYNNPDKTKETSLERYGVDNWSKTDHARSKASKRGKELRKLDILITCPHCAIQIKGKMNFTRWHGDNCKFKTPFFPQPITKT